MAMDPAIEVVLGSTKPTIKSPDKPYRLTDSFTVANSEKFLDYFVEQFKQFVFGLSDNEIVDVDRCGNNVTLRVSPGVYDQMLSVFGELVTTSDRNRRSW